MEPDETSDSISHFASCLLPRNRLRLHLHPLQTGIHISIGKFILKLRL